MFYQRKPVLFYQFDLQDYLQVHGSYINMECDLFGSTAKNTEELLKHLEQCIKSGFSLSEQQKEQYNYYFKYVDDKNSQRICEAIMKELL